MIFAISRKLGKNSGLCSLLERLGGEVSQVSPICHAKISVFVTDLMVESRRTFGEPRKFVAASISGGDGGIDWGQSSRKTLQQSKRPLRQLHHSSMHNG